MLPLTHSAGHVVNSSTQPANDDKPRDESNGEKEATRKEEETHVPRAANLRTQLCDFGCALPTGWCAYPRGHGPYFCLACGSRGPIPTGIPDLVQQPERAAPSAARLVYMQSDNASSKGRAGAGQL